MHMYIHVAMYMCIHVYMYMYIHIYPYRHRSEDTYVSAVCDWFEKVPANLPDFLSPSLCCTESPSPETGGEEKRSHRNLRASTQDLNPRSTVSMRKVNRGLSPCRQESQRDNSDAKARPWVRFRTRCTVRLLQRQENRGLVRERARSRQGTSLYRPEM